MAAGLLAPLVALVTAAAGARETNRWRVGALASWPSDRQKHNHHRHQAPPPTIIIITITIIIIIIIDIHIVITISIAT